jgi:predicted MFS family arabinose efflux permease
VKQATESTNGVRTPSSTLDTFKGLAALLLVHTIGPQTVIILPALVQGYVEQVGLSESQAGYLASIETWGMCLATLAMMVLITRLDWRRLMVASLLTMLLTNALSAVTESIAVLYALRFLAGAGGGIIVAVSYAMIGQTANINRNFGLAIFFVLIYGAVAFPTLPTLYDVFGISGGFLFFAAFALCGLPVTGVLPRSGRAVTEGDSRAIVLSRPLKLTGAAAMLLYFIAQIGVWSYFYRFGIRYGMDEQAVGSALAISQFFGLAGAFSVVLCSSRVRKDLALSVAILLSIACIASLFRQHGFMAFVVVAGIYQFLWNMTHPYLLAALASFDPSGRVIAWGTGMQFLGTAAGPALAAIIITDDSIASVLWMGIVFMLATIACIVPPLVRERQLQEQRLALADSTQ